MLTKQFNKGYFTYFIGIIIPASVSFLVIPLLKNSLGTSSFSIYTYYASVLIIVNASFAGGISQSIMRLQIEYEDKKSFYYKSLYITLCVSLCLTLPLFLFIQTNYHNLIFSFLFILALVFANFYASLLSITQSALLSATSAVSETIRAVVFLGISFLLLKCFPLRNSLLLLFTSLWLSYLFGTTFLLLQNKFSLSQNKNEPNTLWETGKQMLGYGGYLIGWFFCTYALTMSSRFVLAFKFGKENIGHFTASFDILNKSIIFVLSPVLLALFPLVIKAFAAGHYNGVTVLIKRLIFLEMVVMLLSILAFYLFGFPILSKILRTPQTDEYLLIDVEVIAGTFIWQLAMLQHKYLELHKQTGKMFLAIFIALIVSVITDICSISLAGFKYAGLGFALSGFVYFVLVLYHGKNLKEPVFSPVPEIKKPLYLENSVD